MNKQERLLALQYRLYEKIRSRIYNLTGQWSEDLLSYESSFLRTLPVNFKQAKISKFKKNLKNSRVILCGDFHSLPVNQTGFLDIIIYLIKREKEKNLIIALECFSFEDQSLIDDFISKKITEKQFLTQTQFGRYWGFPWEPLRKIFDFARDNLIRIVGINISKGQEVTLSQRDHCFSKNILTHIKKNPKSKLICLIGELHLSTNHLPAALSKQSKLRTQDLMSILFNTDRFYFEVLEQNKNNYPSCLEIGENTFCILDTPPWGKWLSYLLWQEHVLFNPDCETCLAPWTNRSEETCSYDTEDFFIECFKNYIKYFGFQHSYPPAANIYSRVVAVEQEYYKFNRKENIWNLKRFLESASVFDIDSKLIFWRPLSWRGMISAIAQCMVYQNRKNLGKNFSNKDNFFDNVKMSLACYSFEAVFNPIGFLSKTWAKENLPINPKEKVEVIKEQEYDEFPDDISFVHSNNLGKSFSSIFFNSYQDQEDQFDFLHDLLLRDEIVVPPFVNKICTILTNKSN